MTDNQVLCPDCMGKPKSRAFVNTGLDSSSHYSKMIECGRCNGAGYVHQSIIDAIEKGMRLRQERVSRGLSLLDVAIQEGVSVSIVSARERGIFDK